MPAAEGAAAALRRRRSVPALLLENMDHAVVPNSAASQGVFITHRAAGEDEPEGEETQALLLCIRCPDLGNLRDGRTLKWITPPVASFA